MQKGSVQFIILGIAILILVGAGGFYLGRQNLPKLVPSQNQVANPQASPSPTAVADETANWKTYTNRDVGFSIKYPPGWGVITGETERSYHSGLKTVLNIVIAHESVLKFYGYDATIIPVASPTTPPVMPEGAPGVDVRQVSILMFENPNHLSLKEITNLQYSPNFTSSSQSVLVDGIEGIRKITTNRWGAVVFDDVFVEKGGKLYWFSLISADDEDWRETFNQMFSTFKFLD